MIDWLLGTLVATSALIVLVLLVREPVRRHFGARVAYGLWLIPVARLLMPTITHTVERPVTTTVSPRLMMTQISIEPMLLSSVARPELSMVDKMGGWLTILLVLWLGVAIGLFVARMNAFRRERSEILARTVELGRIGSIRIVRSSEVRGPLAFGIFDRVIAVPANFERLYKERERRLAIEHELSHHRSGDLIANLFAFVLLCLQWFNPLAWVAHAAFRFDQEAACDARVLDKGKADDRVSYGRAIAKAASGRALLFASALDRRNTLHRRLKSMLTNPTAGRRLSGRLMVVLAVGAALPLTATRAINYVDVPEPAAHSAAARPIAATAAQTSPPAEPNEPAESADPALPTQPLNISRDGRLVINNQIREWRDLTPAEKAEVRRSLAHAKEELARSNINSAQINHEIRQAMAEAKIDKDEIRKELSEARAEMERAMRDIDAHAVEIRRAGQEPERIKVTIRDSLKTLEAVDVDAITRQALASIDHEAIEISIAEAAVSIYGAQWELEQLEKRFEKDE